MMDEPREVTTFGGCFLAAFRNLAGPGFLLAMGGAEIMNRPAMGSGLDLIFLAAAAASVVAGLLYKPDLEPPKEGRGEVQGISRTAYLTGIIVMTVLVWVLTHFVLRR
jgi:hypothetical protein